MLFKRLSIYISIFSAIICIAISPVLVEQAHARQADILMEVDVEPVLSDAQVVDIRSLSFDASGRGSRVVNLYLQNSSSQTASNLYLDITLQSDRSGTLLTHNQQRIRSFSLQPGQSVYASNNDIARGRLPGVDADLSFDSRWTSAGRDLLNRLEGRTTLPTDGYTLNIELYQGTNLIASESAIIGDELVDGDLDLMLLMPGDIAGTDEVITNPLPYFRWDGPRDLTYRIIVVEDQPGDDPESLIGNARNTAPAREGETPTLLDYEMMDVLTDGTSLQYPSNGVQPLEAGNRYFWQVIATFRSSGGAVDIESEIWSFRLVSDREEDDLISEADDELWNYLEALIGVQAVEELGEGDFELESLEFDDSQFMGESARQELIRLIEKIQQGEARILRD